MILVLIWNAYRNNNIVHNIFFYSNHGEFCPKQLNEAKLFIKLRLSPTLMIVVILQQTKKICIVMLFYDVSRHRVQHPGSQSKPIPLRLLWQSTTNCSSFSVNKSQTSSGTSPINLLPSNVNCSNSSNRPYSWGMVPVKALFFICNRVMFHK